jgi:hypothetical protein
VSWTIQGWNGSAWTNLATKARGLSAAEHGVQVTDTNSVNIAPGITKIKVYFAAGDSNGASYSRGADVYNYFTATPNVTPLSGDIPPLFVSGANLVTSTNGSATYTTPAYSLPGWELYAGSFSADWGVSALPGSGASVNILCKGVSYATASVGASQTRSGSIDTGIIYFSSFTGREWTISYSESGSGGVGYIKPTAITLYYKQLVVNSATPTNNFTFQSYAWNIAGSTAIATGSLNWMAIGD